MDLVPLRWNSTRGSCPEVTCRVEDSAVQLFYGQNLRFFGTPSCAWRWILHLHAAGAILIASARSQQSESCGEHNGRSHRPDDHRPGRARILRARRQVWISRRIDLEQIADGLSRAPALQL